MTEQGPYGNRRVLVVMATNRRRGAEVFGEQLCSGLGRLGWVVDGVSLSGVRDEAHVEIEPLTDIEPGRLGRLNVSALGRLARRIRAFEPDVVVANGGQTLRYCALLSLLGRRPLVYVAIGEPARWLRSGLARSVNRFLLGRVDVVIAVSEATRHQLHDLSPGLAGRVKVVYQGIPPPFFEVGHEAVDDTGPLRVLFLGSLSVEKDPLLALEVVRSVPNTTIRFVGSGPMEEDLRAAITAYDMADSAQLPGSTSDVLPHLAWAQILLLTSRTEGLPGAILEAGAARVPALAVDVGGVGEAIVPDETGLLVERSKSSLVEALARLEANRDIVDDMGTAATGYIRERFALDRSIDEYSRALLEAIR